MKSQNQYLFVILLILAGMGVRSLLPTEVGAAETTAFSLSGAVYREQELDTGLTDVLLAELSKQSGVNILDRSAMKLVFGELTIANLSDDALNQVRLGKILGVDYFAWVKLSDNLAVLEVVEAATGRGVVVKPFRFEQGKLSNTWPAIAAEAVRAARQGAPPISAKMPSLAMTNPRFAVTNETVNSATEALLAMLSGELGGEGVTVLPRRFTRELVTERWRAEKGLVQSDEQQQLIGADYILTFTIDGTPPVLEMGLVESKTGRRIGKCRHPLDEAARNKILTRWIMDRLRLIRNPATPQQTEKRKDLPNTLPEIWALMYSGMVLHNEGRYIDALEKFYEVETCKVKIAETRPWIRSCFRLAGFMEIDEALEKIYQNASTNRASADNLPKQSDPGVSLLGITVAPDAPISLAGPLGIELLDNIHKVTGTTVLAAEDIARLRDEYDLLLGLENVKGTTWKAAPPLFLKNAVTAHIIKDSAQIILRLCLVENCNPLAIRETRTALPSEYSQWKATVADAARHLFTDATNTLPAWQAPPLLIAATEQELIKRLTNKYKDWDYLQLLRLNPTLTGCLQVKSLAGSDFFGGLALWLLHSLPQNDPDRPWIEFAIVANPVLSSYSSFGCGHSQKVAPLYVDQFRILAQKHPDHPVGLVSRYNVLISEMQPDNFERTQAEMDRLVSAMQSLNPELIGTKHNINKALQSIQAMAYALKYALGKPEGEPGEVMNHINGLLLLGIYGDINVRPDDYPRLGPGFSFLYLQPKDQPIFLRPVNSAKMRLDLEARCVLRDQNKMSMDFLRAVIDKQGKNSELSRYIALKYAPKTAIWETDWKPEDLRIVFDEVNNSIQQLLKNAPPSCTTDEIRDQTQFIRDARHYLKDLTTNDVGPATRNKEPVPSARIEKQPAVVGNPLEMSCEPSNLSRLHELFDNAPKSQEIALLYCRFALTFFRQDRYDLAEPLLEQIVAWKDAKGRPPERQVYVLSSYLLALLKHRNGNTPEALRLAKDALDFIEKYPQAYKQAPKTYILYQTINVNGNGAWSEPGELKIWLIKFIKAIRDNPEAPFIDLYEKKF
jgi:hypothetical protein